MLLIPFITQFDPHPAAERPRALNPGTSVPKNVLGGTTLLCQSHQLLERVLAP
jgi:hypothetical protein